MLYYLPFAQVFAVGMVGVLGFTSSAQADDGALLRGVEAIDDNLPWFDAEPNYETYDLDLAGEEPIGHGKRPTGTTAVTSLGSPPMPDGLRLMLSREVYPAKDGYLDAVLRLDASQDQPPRGAVEVTVRTVGGETIASEHIDPIPAAQLYFSVRMPESLVGEEGALHVNWLSDEGEVIGAGESSFRIREPEDIARSGRVELTLPNDNGVTLRGAPVSVGVPFPRGALDSVDHLRLVDEHGDEVPLQASERARWSRFGSVRWVMCDFTADLDGDERRYFLEFGPDVRRAESEPLDIAQAQGLPHIDLGRVRLDDGLAFDAHGDGDFAQLVAAPSLTGAFIEHARDRWFSGYVWRHMRIRSGFHDIPEQYMMPADEVWEIEERGPVKTVLRQEGWYRKPSTGERFCKYVVRYVMHRGSPIVRIFHTWIFTGDSNRDRISNMGWRFPLAEGVEPIGFLTDFDEPRWITGDYLLQHDFDRHEVADDGDIVHEGGRAPGVMAAATEDARLYIGVKDFWQNYPSELEYEADSHSLVFHAWPRHGRERSRPVRREDAYRLWFAHEGEVMDLRLPREMTEGDFYRSHSRGEPHWAYGMPESVNAQGVAKTTEMWLYATQEDADKDEALAVLAGLNDEKLRAVVDPRWVADSGAFYEVGPRDTEALPEIERLYEMSLESISNQIERMGIYGMWVYGDLLRSPDLDAQEAPNLYRIFRKAHWGWPFSWIPFARSGDARYLKLAEAATRMLSDVAYVHYVSDDVREHFANLPERTMWDAKQPFRERGWHNRNLIPWAGYWGPTSRMYVDEAEHLWHAWFLTGYHRARDVALDWAEQTKIEHPNKLGRGPITAASNRARWTVNLQKQYLEMYKNTFDPWFLAGAHALAELHLHRYRQEQWRGHFWTTGPREFQRYTGDSEHLQWYLAFAERQADWHHRGWAWSGIAALPSSLFAYELTGEDYYLRRAAGIADLAKWSLIDIDEPWYYRGFYNNRGGSGSHTLFTSWMQKWFPLAIGAFQRAGDVPADPIPLAFDQRLGNEAIIAVRKEAGEALPLRLTMRRGHAGPAPEDARPEGAFRIVGPNGETVMEGDRGGQITLDAELPGGVYRVSLDRPVTRLPISPPDTPEVVVLGEDRHIGPAYFFAQYWFHVPEHVRSFEIEFENPEPFRQAFRQVVVWDADGREAWAHRERTVDHDPDQEHIVARIEVSADQAGRLWRVTAPGWYSLPMRLDARLPRMVAHSADRWFDPDARE